MGGPDRQPFLAALNVFEIESRKKYAEHFPDQAWQLNQNVTKHHGMKSTDDYLHTLIHNCGLTLGSVHGLRGRGAVTGFQVRAHISRLDAIVTSGYQTFMMFRGFPLLTPLIMFCVQRQGSGWTECPTTLVSLAWSCLTSSAWFPDGCLERSVC